MKRVAIRLSGLSRFSATFMAIVVIAGCATGITITKQSLLEQKQATVEREWAKTPSSHMVRPTTPVEISGMLRQVKEVKITNIDSGELVLFDEDDFTRSKTYSLIPGTYEVTVLSGKDTESSITVTVAENWLTSLVLTPAGILTAR